MCSCAISARVLMAAGDGSRVLKNTRSHAEVAESEAKEEAIIYMLAAGDSRFGCFVQVCETRADWLCVQLCDLCALCDLCKCAHWLLETRADWLSERLRSLAAGDEN